MVALRTPITFSRQFLNHMSDYRVELSENFQKEAKRLVKKYPSLAKEIQSLLNSLRNTPTQGTPIGKNCYKIRLAIKSKGKGKSGGARAISCMLTVEERVILLSIYDKSEQADIADNFLKQLLKENEG